MQKQGFAVLALVLAALTAADAHAFGTIRQFGQNAEHERITRAALAASFEPRTLSLLAGDRGAWGAVGAPDNPLRGLMSSHAAHCDGGDHLDLPGYRQTREAAQRILTSCRTYIMHWIEQAVIQSAPLARENAAEAAQDCRFEGRPRTSRCAVIEYLGMALHASQDFYSHSNWVDRAAPGATGPRNPPGLGNEGRAPWLDPRVAAAFPAGLISGCYDGFPETFHCSGRVKHEALNKDNGPIGASGATGPGSSARGAINGNFERAVAAAIEDTRDKWAYFQERVIALHGDRDGRVIVCAVSRDDPRSCYAS